MTQMQQLVQQLVRRQARINETVFGMRMVCIIDRLISPPARLTHDAVRAAGFSDAEFNLWFLRWSEAVGK